jgi:NAD(P)-dependent dehydrogenase (short-subunit alcohol dehydrogenase family)
MSNTMRSFLRIAIYITTAAALLLAVAATTATAQDGAPARAVLVTGSTSGIGYRMTEVLSQNGFHVYAGARTPEEMARMNAMPNVTAVRLDVTIQSDIDEAVAFVEGEGRGLWGLINNAGIATMEPLIEMPEEVMDYQLDVNLMGPYRVTKGFADLIIESRGRVLNTTSIAGIVTGPFSGAYSMSKHGLEAYTDGLAAELSRFGVAVAAVEPGNYRSQILASMVERMREQGYSAEGSRYGDMLDLVGGDVSRSQYKDPDEVAQAALEFMTTDTPRHRYMVVPNRGEAELTIRGLLAELVQLNGGQPYEFSRDELVGMLDDALGQAAPARAAGGGEETGGARGPGLLEAVIQGDIDALRRNIDAGADLDEREPSAGSTPLIAAATFGRVEAAEALIEAGADLDVQNNDGSTALMTAALLARSEIVRALLDAGADRDLRNNAGVTALDIANTPFESLRGVYDYLSAALGPYGLELDYDRIRDTLPEIADMLR